MAIHPGYCHHFDSSRTGCENAQIAMYAIQLIITLVQAGFAIASSVMTCKATCCAKKQQAGTVYYTSPSNLCNTATIQPTQVAQVQQGYITIPINSNTVTVVPTAAVAEHTTTQSKSEGFENDHAPPPNYEDITMSSTCDNVPQKGTNYQRLD